jgi:guanylate kinase
MTTRPPRSGEVDGREYYFVSRERFESVIAVDGLIEYATYVGNYYGTPTEYVEKQLAEGKDVILEIEIQGALKVREKFPTALLLFVMPPSIAELRRRIVKRGTESSENIEKRLKRAVEEAEGIEHYDFIVINDDLDECAKRMHEIIATAHAAPFRNQDFIERLREELALINK